jgi:2-polyprenyl-3-methyl-5-hydroxy-6-metoxy-1,4-benzoquinol methylase
MENVVNRSNEFLLSVIGNIESIDRQHGVRLRKLSLVSDQAEFIELNDVIYDYFTKCNTSALRVAIDYMHMVSDMKKEMLYFERHDSYSCKSQKEAFEKVYSQPEVMSYYMNGLMISQLLWSHHYNMYKHFKTSIKSFFQYKGWDKNRVNVLDIGAGHGLFSFIARKNVKNIHNHDIVDISASSLQISELMLGQNKINYVNEDISQFDPDNKYDLIIIGEVLEHLDNPYKMLAHAKNLLSDNGILWLTVPVNAPAIDHVFLFRDAEEVLEMVKAAGLKGLHTFKCIAEMNNKTELVGKFCKK